METLSPAAVISVLLTRQVSIILTILFDMRSIRRYGLRKAIMTCNANCRISIIYDAGCNVHKDRPLGY